MPMLTLIGYRGTGKSVVAGRLAEHLATSWVDADAVLEERTGCTIAELVCERGEAAFRDVEESLLAELVGTVRGVLATGGGVVLREENRRLLRERSRPVVWLTAAAAEIKRRLAADPATRYRRPALAGVDPLAEVDEALLRREPLYRSCADRIVDTSSRTPDEVAREIADWLARGAAATGSGGAAG